MRALALALVLSATLGLAACSTAMRGSMALADGNYDLALKYYNEALASDPDSIYLHKRVGMVYFAKQDYARAELVFQDVLDHSPGEPEALFYLGLSRIGKGEREPALRDLTTFRWPFKFYHQKFVQEEAARLLKHPETPPGQAIRSLQDELEKGKAEQIIMERESRDMRN